MIAAGWVVVLLGRAPAGLMVALVGNAGLAVSLAGAREASRSALRTGPHHDAQGLPLFVIALVVGVVAIAWCVRVARRATATPARD